MIRLELSENLVKDGWNQQPVLHDEIVNWCKENLKNKYITLVAWKNDSGQPYSKLFPKFVLNMIFVTNEIEFETEEDAILFKMRWY